RVTTRRLIRVARWTLRPASNNAGINELTMRYTSRPRKSPRQSLFGQRDAYGRRRLSKFEVLEGRQLLTASPLSNWQNADNPRDVNNDGRVSALDAVLVISHLLSHGA